MIFKHDQTLKALNILLDTNNHYSLNLPISTLDELNKLRTKVERDKEEATNE